MRSKTGGSANLTTMYVDMSSADKEEKRIYGSASDEENKPYTMYARPLKRYSHSNTISIPAKMTGQSNAPIATFSKTPDFVLNTWNQVTLPGLKIKDGLEGEWRIAYTWNLAHHIWKGGALKFNDLTAQEFDSAILDNLSQFRGKHSMSALYQKMIGNTKELQTFSGELPAATVKLPTPFFYSRDTTFALPLCAASMNEIYEEYDVETDLAKLVRVQWKDPDDLDAVWTDVKAKSVDFSAILDVERGKAFEVPMTKTWVKYAAISDEEREDFTDEPMYVYIERFQAQNGKKAGPGEHRLEFHMNGPVTQLFFNFANITSAEYNNHSNYSDTTSTSSSAADPMSKATLGYESEARFEEVPGDHFDMDTLLSAERPPTEVGYHMLSYGRHINDLTPTHSSNFSNLVTTFEADVVEKSGEENTYMLQLRAISLRRVRYKSNIFGIPPASEE